MSKKLTLQDAIAAQPQPRTGFRCHTCVTVESMTPEDKETFNKILGTETITINMIVQACKAAGYPEITAGTLKRHRRGECVPLT